MNDYVNAKKFINTAIDSDRTNQRQFRILKWQSIIDQIDIKIALESKSKELEEKILRMSEEYNQKLDSVHEKHTSEMDGLYRTNLERSTIILVIIAGFTALIIGAMDVSA